MKRYPVMNGAEAFFYKGNHIGILISHGFVGTPQSIRYIGESLAKYGFTVHAPRLKGHGTDYRELETSTHEEWFSDLETGYFRLKEQCTEIFVIGQSMGGALSLLLAHKYPEIKGVALINAALAVPSYEKYRESSLPQYIPETSPDIKAKDVYEITYHKVPISAIHELQRVMEKVPSVLTKITTPVLGLKSLEDHVVPSECTDFIIENISSEIKELVPLLNSYHVASMDNDKDIIVEYCHQFVQQQLSVLNFYSAK